MTSSEIDSLAAALAEREEAEIVWWRLTAAPMLVVDWGMGGIGGFDVCEDIQSGGLDRA